jgi:phosphatidylglycerophosphate synthase
MMAVRDALTAASIGLVVLLGVLSVAPGLGVIGGVAGLACGAVLAGALARLAGRAGVERCGPADLVTIVRGTLACGVAALVAEGASTIGPGSALVALATLALALDAVDGPVARRTRTASPFGARLDGETDAFLMLVLSVHVAVADAAWVLAIGLVRYVFAVAGWLLPWMRADLPPRYWRKVVTAVAGVALVVAAADVTSPLLTSALLGVAVLLLAESFGRDVWWLRRRHQRGPTLAETGAAVREAARTAPR